MTRRIGVCSAVIVVVFGILTARVVQLQVLSGDRYQRLTVAQTLHTIPISAERGSIFDRSGRDLALSVRRSTVYADPTLVTDPVGEAAKLAPVLHADEQYLVKQLSARPYRFAYLAHTVPDATASAVTALGLPGIGLMPEPARSYPAGPLAGALLGRVGTDGLGTDGLEYLYNSLLDGKPGELVVEQDPQGHDIPNTQRTRVEARRGSDVVLTVDEDVQWEAEHALLDQVRATGAASGMSAVVDVSDGDVLAIASVDGATRSKAAHVASPGGHNAPLTELFAPGSTTKLITLSWALEHGHVTPSTTFTVPYSITVDPHVKPFYDAEWHATEQWTTADILRQSSNVGTIQIAKRMTNNELAAAVRAFGLGVRTSIDWPGQPEGLVLPPDQYYATGKYSTAIGYGAAVTAMQMLDAFVTIANGGMTRPPHLLGATVDPDGARHPFSARPSTRVVSPAIASAMTTMMRGVVTDGTGVCAAIPGYPVAGKTGTSKKLQADGTYSTSSTMASFIGYAPADHPRFAAIVVLDSPAYQFQFGGAAAAPVWSEMMQFVLTHYGVAPTDRDDAQYRQAQQVAKSNGTRCAVPHGDALARAIAARRAQPQGQPAPGPAGAPSGGPQSGGSTSSPATSGTPDSLPADTSPSN